MIDEEEKQKYIEATKCSECTQWHHHCEAECCRTIVLNINPKKLKEGSNYIFINPGKLGLNDMRYYKFHGVDYLRGLLRFKKDRIFVVGNKVIYAHDCERLDGNMCLDHPNKKPELCQALTLDSAKVINERFCLTSNCLFKYKCKEVKKNE